MSLSVNSAQRDVNRRDVNNIQFVPPWERHDLPFPFALSHWLERGHDGQSERTMLDEKKAAYEGEQMHLIEEEPRPPVVMKLPRQPELCTQAFM